MLGHTPAISGVAEPAARRNRAALLANVRSKWITNNLRHPPEAMRLRYSLAGTESSLLTQFEEGGRAFLLLGAPGSGKTFTLLEIAEALLTRAEQDETQPIPVIFPLTSWADKQLSLEEWCRSELARHYGVPLTLGKAWMEQEEILPLLDGLDEMAPSARPACVRAINEFRQAHGLAGLVVSCRKEAYEALPEPLALQTALEIQPLTLEQVDLYLAGNPGLKAVRAALQTDQGLAEVVRSPLMLSVMVLAYEGVRVAEMVAGTVDERRARLFDAYTRRLFHRHHPRLAAPRTYLHWLQTVSVAMAAQDSRIFYLDDLQPDSLNPHQQHVYRLARGLVVGLTVCLVVGLVAGLPLGLVAGLLMGRREMQHAGEIELIDHVVWIKPNWQMVREELAESLLGGLVAGLVVGLPVGLVAGLVMGPAEGLRWVVGTVLFVELVGQVVGLIVAVMGGAPIEEIRPREKASQLLKTTLLYALLGELFGKLLVGLLGGLVVGLGVGLVRGLDVGLLVGLRAGLTIWLAVWLLAGLLGGGKSLWYHFLLRAILAHAGRLPFRLVTFLDEAHDLLFLRRVGSGYRFYHALLQDHIQRLDVETFDLRGENEAIDGASQ